MNAMGRLESSPDVLVIGGGPAGLAAATELAAGGLDVLLVERERETGGVPRFCQHSPFGMREFHRVLRGGAYARRLTEDARRAGVRIAAATTVTAIAPGPEVTLSSAEGLRIVRPRRVLLATGTREATRAQRMTGGTKPFGVMTTGALQSIAGLDDALPFRRPLIVGTELVSFSALMTCLGAGMKPVAMITAERWVASRWPSSLFPRLRGVPLLRETRLVTIDGVRRVSGVELATPTGPRRLDDVDAVIFTGAFRPEAALCRTGHLAIDPATGGPVVDSFGRCSDPVFFAAGNLLRPVETAGHCWSEGRAIARAVLRDLHEGLPGPERATQVRASGGLRYCVPQRVIVDDDPAFDAIQVRIGQPVHGARLRMMAGGREISERGFSGRPERRILLALPPQSSDPVEISVGGRSR